MIHQKSETERARDARLQLNSTLSMANVALHNATLITASAMIATAGEDQQTIGTTLAKLQNIYQSVREHMIHVQIATNRLMRDAEPNLFTANPTGPQGPTEPA